MSDLGGHVVGLWNVVEIAPSSGARRWLCRCECGTERSVSEGHLKAGVSQSCGCARRLSILTRAADASLQPLSLPGEVWRPVPGGILGEPIEASSLGRIRTTCVPYVYKLKRYRGYDRVRIKKHFFRVHRLVAAAFVPNPENKPDINHCDGIKHHNTPENLEWCTPLENSQHANAMGLVPSFKGEANGASKLTESDVIQIRRWYPLGLRQVDLADAFSVSQRAISLVVRGEKWKHV